MALLKVTTGPAAGQLVDVDHEIVIGREGADLTIDDPEMSRRHTIVRPAQDGLEIEDLGSTNGTFVDGIRISGAVTLRAGSALRLGVTSLVVDLGEEKTVLRAAPAHGRPETNEPRSEPVVPDLDATTARARPVVPDLDATAPRARPVVPDLDATAPRARPVVPDLDATAPRARPVVPDLDATTARARPVVPDLDATTARARPVVPDLDATTARARPVVPEPAPPVADVVSPPSKAEATDARKAPRWRGWRRSRHDTGDPALVAARAEIARLEELVEAQRIELATLRADQHSGR